jgi:formate hydrogenlyase subunit 3/multisubunit Na+/H+ antiporter MnhD subunit
LSHIFACLGFAVTFTSVVLLIESWATEVPDPKERKKKAEAYSTAYLVLLSLTAVFLITSLVLQKTGSARVSRD